MPYILLSGFFFLTEYAPEHRTLMIAGFVAFLMVCSDFLSGVLVEINWPSMMGQRIRRSRVKVLSLSVV